MYKLNVCSWLCALSPGLCLAVSLIQAHHDPVDEKLVMFRIGQKTSRGFDRSIDLGAIAPLVGLVGGTRTMRKHS